MIHLARLLALFVAAPSVCAQSWVVVNENQTNPNQPSVDPIDDEQIWSHFGTNTRHQSRALLSNLTPSLSAPAWIATGDGSTLYIPIPQTGLVVDRKRVYTLASDPTKPGSSFIVAYDRSDGGFVWASPIPPAILDSWSTPAIDIQHNQIIVASSQSLTAIDSNTGKMNWSTPIPGVVVNASPVVTSDLGDSDRVMITNHTFGTGATSLLVCINTDPFHATDNPYQPGEIVWQTPLLGESSGNTPAYTNGFVYVSSASSPGSLRGQVHAFDIRTNTPPTPTWTFTNTIDAGFFSGVSVVRGHVYASSYNFSGLQFSANTVKLNKLSGQLIWSIPTNRTDATPIVLNSGDVVVSGGIATPAYDFLPFYGSLPSIQYIQDSGSTPALLWDSAIDTLDDANSNGVWDFGETFLSIGGWTHQPVSIHISGSPKLLVGTLPQAAPGVLFGHNTDLRLIDLSKSPTDPGFILEHFFGTGSTPAMLGSWIYAPGQDGVHAFEPLGDPIIARELIRRYTQGQLTLDQLIEHLAK